MSGGREPTEVGGCPHCDRFVSRFLRGSALRGRVTPVRPTRALVVPVLLSLLAACSGSSKPARDPGNDLAAAKTRLDTTPGVHFTLTASPLPPTGTWLESAEGDAVPPSSSFSGEAKIHSSAFSATVKAISVGGVVYVKQPFAPGFQKVDPASLHLVDPGVLLSPDKGISTFLTADPAATAAGQVRVGSEVLDRYQATVPEIGVLATDAKDVRAAFDLVPSTHELRRIVLTGPFFAADTQTTVTLTLTDYGKRVDIKAP